MNIIITSGNGTRLTQWDRSKAYDINTVFLYCTSETGVPSKFKLSYVDDSIDTEEVFQTKTFEISVLPSELGNINNYVAYDLSADFAIKERSYKCEIILASGAIIALTDELILKNDYLEDEHPTLRIDKRTIVTSNNTNLLIAQDSLSQQISFEIKECYDGVSFLDNTKKIYVDFIPSDYHPTIDQPAFYSSKILTKESIIREGESWMRFKWNVPFRATRAAGSLKIAVAITDNKGYVWQTSPTALTVLPNIGLRPAIPQAPEDNETDASEIAGKIQTLEEFVMNLNNVESIDEENGIIVYTTRKNGVESSSEISVAELMSADLADEDYVVSGGGAEEGV